MKNYKPKIEELKRLINAIDKYQSDFDKINIPGYLHIMSFYNLNRLIQDIEPVIELLAKMNNTINKLKKTISQLELTKIPVQANNLIKKLKNNWDKYTSTLTEFKIEFDTIFLPLLGFNSDNNLKKIPLFDNELSKVAAKGMFENYENWNILTPTRNTLHEVEEKYKKKGVISQMIVSKNGSPALDEIEFEFVNKKDPKDIITKRSSNGMLTGVELNIGDIYTIRVKNNDNYVFEQDVEIRDMDGDTVAFKVGTEEPVVQLDLISKG